MHVSLYYRWEKDGELLATTSSENYTTDVHRVTSRGNYSCAAVNEGVGVGPKGYAYISVYGKIFIFSVITQ